MAGLIALPAWRYDFLERAGKDMSECRRVERMDEAEKDRVVAYTNRSARRAAARQRGK